MIEVVYSGDASAGGQWYCILLQICCSPASATMPELSIAALMLFMDSGD